MPIRFPGCQLLLPSPEICCCFCCRHRHKNRDRKTSAFHLTHLSFPLLVLAGCCRCRWAYCTNCSSFSRKRHLGKRGQVESLFLSGKQRRASDDAAESVRGGRVRKKKPPSASTTTKTRAERIACKPCHSQRGTSARFPS